MVENTGEWWNDEVKAAAERKEAAWKKVLGARDENTKINMYEVYKERER